MACHTRYGEKMENKRIIIDFYELHIFGASFFFNIDELLAFIYFQSVIIVPKVRSDRNYCYIEGNGCPSNMVAKCFSKKLIIFSEVEELRDNTG